ncbi:MAG: hypothetical protein WCJ30_14380, partial [Deltaproteobacteria bacterium]
VERADGNAFYLEELIRRAVEWGDDDLPETVVAMVQSRMEAIGPEARRVLRAASVFGERFWPGGLQRLLGHADPGETERWLRQLVEQEIVDPPLEGRFQGHPEYGFRHGLLRDAAYATLTETDRTAAHRLAGEWLVAAGERQARVLAAHFERGGDAVRAMPWIVAAMDLALTAYQLDEALDLARRGLSLGARGVVRGLLSTVVAEVLTWKGDTDSSRDAALDGIRHCERGSPAWFLCASLVVVADANSGDAGQGSLEVLDGILSLERPPEPTGRCAFAITMVQYGLLLAGRRDLIDRIVEPLRAAASQPLPHDEQFTGWLKIADGYAGIWCGDRLGHALRSVREGAERLLASKPVAGVEGRGHLATTLVECGAFAEAEAIAGEWIDSAKQRGLDWMIGLAASPLSRALLHQGRTGEAVAAARSAVGDVVPASAHLARCALALALVAAGDLDAATLEATREIDSSPIPATRVASWLVLSRVSGARGEWPEALDRAIRGLDEADRLAAYPSDRAALRVMCADALTALGETAEASAVITAARATLEQTAASFDDPTERVRFIEAFPAHARILAWEGPSRVP